MLMNLSILFFLAIGLMSALLNSTAPTPLYPLYQSEFNLTSVSLTLIYAAYAAGVIITLLTVGYISKKLSDLRYMIIPSLILVFLGSAVFAFADSFVWLFTARVIAGIGTGALTGAANVSLVRYGPNDNGKIAALIATLSFTTGLALGPVVSGFSLQLNCYPTVSPFVFIMVFSIIALVGIMISWPKNIKEGRGNKMELNECVSDNSISSNKNMYSSRKFFIVSFSLFICWVIAASIFSLGPSIAQEVLGIHKNGIFGYVMAVYLIIAGVSQIVSRKISPELSLFYGGVSIFCAVLILFLSLFFGSVFLASIGLIIAGYSYGAVFVGCATLINIISPKMNHSKIVSKFYFIAYVANWVPVLLGMIVDHISLVVAADVLLLISFVICGLMSLLIKKTDFYLIV